ncbi:prepilin peptidase [Listeria weihenstephanensis]|uniref:Prepilin peptidase n=1 Tax=Listeria weihenstephanensis TaxID=1006155 RepID=A0A1S7FV83_9LIST|nr:prepilin peptidase [Listeria weihenstephanensis]AQY51279.1 hypothetical protein UE46_09580 [Listeria weihenstephanensis]MBC1500293.1 prepilin peptidase [Listeria weihenstephanensis]
MVYFILSVYSSVFASFLHVVGANYPIGRPFLFRSSSECDFCKTKLSMRFMIPIFSFIFLKGKTNCCGQSMSKTYIFVETLAPIFVCSLYALYGFEANFYAYIISFSLLLILFVSDMLYLHIPNRILLIYFIFAAIFYAYTDMAILFHQLEQFLLGGVTFLSLYLLIRKGIGLGDIKLLIVLCFLLSYKEVLFVFIAAVFVGTLIMSTMVMLRPDLKMKKIPFVPFILSGFVWSPFLYDMFWDFILRQ